LQKERRFSLNVKDPEAHRLAQAIAAETGETLTRAVTEALRERYDRLQRRRTKASVQECARSRSGLRLTSVVRIWMTPSSSTMNTGYPSDPGHF
jgi:hypothetical protein